MTSLPSLQNEDVNAVYIAAYQGNIANPLGVCLDLGAGPVSFSCGLDGESIAVHRKHLVAFDMQEMGSVAVIATDKGLGLVGSRICSVQSMIDLDYNRLIGFRIMTTIGGCFIYVWGDELYFEADIPETVRESSRIQ